MKGAKLWKRILNEGILNTGRSYDQLQQLILCVLSQTIIVDTRPWPKEPFTAWEKFINLALPFDSFWCEGNLPSDGALWGAIVKQDKDPMAGAKAEYLAHELPLAALPGFHRIIRILCFNAEPIRKPTLFGQMLFAVNKSGSVLSPRPLLYVGPQTMLAIGEKAAVTYVQGIGTAAIELMLLLGCKNVSTQPHDGDPSQVRRAIKRRGGTTEDYRYHTLVVRPPGAKSDAPAQDIGMMPRHVCRGHFSEYGPEFNKGLLFGKYSGRFYIPPHLKGDKKNGVVEKDYAIAPMLPGPTQ